MRHAISRRQALHSLFVSATGGGFVLLAACGGGGSGSSTPAVGSEPPVPPPQVLPPVRAAHWSATPVQIDSSVAVGAAGLPALVADAAGNVTAAWTQVQNGRVGINGSTYQAATASWSAPVPLEDPDAGDAGRPALVIHGSGDVTVMWSQANNQGSSTIHARRYDAAQRRWGASEQVRTAARAANPVLVVDGADSLTSAWHEQDPDSGSQRLVASRFQQGSWSEPVALSSPDAFGIVGDATLGADASGNVVAAWAEEPLTGSSFIIINARRFDGAGWSASVRIDTPVATPSGSLSYAPALVTDRLERVTLAWIQDDAAGVSVFTSRLAGDGWSAPTRISGESTTAGNAVRVVADSAGNVTALWDEFTPDNVHHLSSSRFNALAGEWSAPVQIHHADTGIAQNPTLSLASEADGDLVAVWTGFKTRSIVASSRYVAAIGAWDVPQQIDAAGAAGDATSPVVTLDAAGKATAAWVQLQGGRTAINSNRYE